MSTEDMRASVALSAVGGAIYVSAELASLGVSLSPIPLGDFADFAQALAARSSLLALLGVLSWVGLLLFVSGTTWTLLILGHEMDRVWRRVWWPAGPRRPEEPSAVSDAEAEEPSRPASEDDGERAR